MPRRFGKRGKLGGGRLDWGLVHLQAHSIMDLIISQGDMVLIHSIPVQTFIVSGSKHDGVKSGGYLARAAVTSAYHFFNVILVESVPVWAAMSFLRSPTVSSGLHFTRT